MSGQKKETEVGLDMQPILKKILAFPPNRPTTINSYYLSSDQFNAYQLHFMIVPENTYLPEIPSVYP